MSPAAWPWKTIGAGVMIAAILAAVGGPAAVASYRHAWTVADRYGTDPTMNPWLPLTTDGMIVAALTVLVVRRWRRVHVGAWPIIWALLGFAATLAANLAAVSTGSWISAIAVPVVAVWPPIAFAVTLELVVTLLRPGASTTSRIRQWWARATDPATAAVTSSDRNARPPALPVHSDPVDEHAADLDAVFKRDQPEQDHTRRPQLVKLATAQTEPEPSQGDLTEDDQRILAEILDQYRGDETGPLPTASKIRRTYRIGPPRSVRIHRALIDAAGVPS